MKSVIEVEVPVSFGQFYLACGEAPDPDFALSFDGQVNRMCGASLSGLLFCRTGIHTGPVALTISLAKERPPVNRHEDAVEVSFQPLSSVIRVLGWPGAEIAHFSVTEPSYRVRYSGQNVDQGKELDFADPGELAPDVYALTFWPEDPQPDGKISVVSDTVKVWHGR